MDLNKLRYSKTVAVKDMEAHSNKTEKVAFRKRQFIVRRQNAFRLRKR